jgi:hypothetical protein
MEASIQNIVRIEKYCLSLQREQSSLLESDQKLKQIQKTLSTVSKKIDAMRQLCLTSSSFWGKEFRMGVSTTMNHIEEFEAIREADESQGIVQGSSFHLGGGTGLSCSIPVMTFASITQNPEQVRNNVQWTASGQCEDWHWDSDLFEDDPSLINTTGYNYTIRKNYTTYSCTNIGFGMQGVSLHSRPAYKDKTRLSLSIPVDRVDTRFAHSAICSKETAVFFDREQSRKVTCQSVSDFYKIRLNERSLSSDSPYQLYRPDYYCDSNGYWSLKPVGSRHPKLPDYGYTPIISTETISQALNGQKCAWNSKTSHYELHSAQCTSQCNWYKFLTSAKNIIELWIKLYDSYSADVANSVNKIARDIPQCRLEMLEAEKQNQVLREFAMRSVY